MSSFARLPWLIVQSAMNPATIITLIAPLLIIVSEAFFRSNSSELYIRILKTKEVCGLLDHRTQMYTLIVAYFFFLLQTGEIVFRRLRTTSGTIDLRKKEAFPGYCALTMLVSVVAFFWLMLTGHFMTSDVVEQYSNLPGCVGGNVGTMQMPPLTSPITIFRVGTGFLAALISYLDIRAE